MRANKRREVEKALLEDLRAKRLTVECGECGTTHRAEWQACIVRNRKSWIARSRVECPCGCTLESYMGDSVPIFMLQEQFGGDQKISVDLLDGGPVLSFVRRALQAEPPGR
jgi:hypothetical protein